MLCFLVLAQGLRMLEGWFGIWVCVCQGLRFQTVWAIPPLELLAWCGLLVVGLCVVNVLLICAFVCLCGLMGLDCLVVGLGFGFGCVKSCGFTMFGQLPL